MNVCNHNRPVSSVLTNQEAFFDCNVKIRQTSKQTKIMRQFLWSTVSAWNQLLGWGATHPYHHSFQNLIIIRKILLLNAVPKIFMNSSKGETQPNRRRSEEKATKGWQVWTDQYKPNNQKATKVYCSYCSHMISLGWCSLLLLVEHSKNRHRNTGGYNSKNTEWHLQLLVFHPVQVVHVLGMQVEWFIMSMPAHALHSSWVEPSVHCQSQPKFSLITITPRYPKYQSI